MNQLQKDIQTALWLIDEYISGDDIDFVEDAINRLRWYVEQDLSYDHVKEDYDLDEEC